jgi:hypothetical protein
MLLRNPNREGQGTNWAVEPYDDDDDVFGDELGISVSTVPDYRLDDWGSIPGRGK